MKIADMHVHSIFSNDGVSTMEEHCVEAISKGIDILCFTDHVDFNSAAKNLGQIQDMTKSNFDIDMYFDEIERLKTKYSNIEILCGIEFSEPHLFEQQFSSYEKKPFDYILASVHHCYGAVFPGAANLSEDQALREYYEIMVDMLEGCNMQALAHMDFPRRYFDSWDINQIVIDLILKLLIQKDIVLEINTSTIDSVCCEPMPRYSIIKRYAELGGRKVVLGSDAHCYANLANGFEMVMRRLPRELRIGYFKNRVFVPL